LSARAWCALMSIPDRAPLLAQSVDRSAGAPVASLVETVGCPACARPMERGRFAAGSDVVIDVCERQHGLWLDAGELVGLLGFVARRREVGAEGAEREVAASEPGRDLELRIVASQPPSRIVVVERRRGFGLPLAVIVVALLAASAGGALFLKRTLPSKLVEEAPKKSAEEVQ
jgi:Zn-finger nucleic acid-binding protein